MNRAVCLLAFVILSTVGVGGVRGSETDTVSVNVVSDTETTLASDPDFLEFLEFADYWDMFDEYGWALEDELVQAEEK